MLIRKLLLPIFVLVIPWTATASAWKIEQSFDVSNDGQLSVRTERGSISVDTHSTTQVAVSIEIWGFDEDEVEVDFDHKGDSLDIDADVSGRSFGQRRIRFQITVPENYNLDLSTEGGSIQVEALKGQVEVDTSGGSLTFFDIVGDIDGSTSGGSIELEKVEGEVDVKTSGGSIQIEDVTGHVVADTSGGTIGIREVKGNVEAETSGGSIRLNDIMGSLEASTSGGSIRASFSHPPGGDVSLDTSGGSVKVELPTNTDMTVRARGHKVYSDFPVDGVTQAKRRLSGDINAGGPLLDLHSSGGSVYIEKRD